MSERNASKSARAQSFPVARLMHGIVRSSTRHFEGIFPEDTVAVPDQTLAWAVATGTTRALFRHYRVASEDEIESLIRGAAEELAFRVLGLENEPEEVARKSARDLEEIFRRFLHAFEDYVLRGLDDAEAGTYNARSLLTDFVADEAVRAMDPSLFRIRPERLPEYLVPVYHKAAQAAMEAIKHRLDQ